MLLNKSSNYAPAKIAEELWPEELDLDNTRKNIRNLIYRFRQSYNLLSPYRLIESTSRGYCLNPNLVIRTDLQLFDKFCSMAQQTGDTSLQIEYLIKAFELYRGEVLEQASGEHWLIPVSNRYVALYETVVNTLLEKLAKEFALHCIQHYALESLRFIPDNWKAHYWLIFAACHSSAVELAKKQLQTSRTKLNEEDYLELLDAVKKSSIPQKESLFS